ncbi:MAG: amino acid dehydrogenase [Geminicoccaceae bacterium]|nr:amino acid dehydrogenase [Geminicoccaceae bacterium]MDW8368939.1 Glu/Leu/Phe/Val dehydrogenase dimerization domain-containing protein [Geminicoccaceae bacterium]
MRAKGDGRGDLATGGALHPVVDPSGQTLAVIALDAPELGPAVGGCRMRPYPDLDAAIAEARALARAMTTKVLLAGLPYSGGKTVVIGDPARDKSPALWRALGVAIEQLAGRYWTGEDSGTTPTDMDRLARFSRYVLGRSAGAGDLGPMTAEGVLLAMRVAARYRFGADGLDGLTVAIQGLGAVGRPLAERLTAAGARLLVADLEPVRVARVVERLGARAVDPASILQARADILAPCAFGPVFDLDSVPQLRCAVVLGAANNQLAGPEVADGLQARGILYVPDYVVNAGGVIAATAELDPGGYDGDRVRARLSIIEARVARILAEAALHGRTPLAVADELARRLWAARRAATGRRASPARPYRAEREAAKLA